MKKIKFYAVLVIAIIMTMLVPKVFASSSDVFVNSNGVELTRKEKLFVDEFYGDNFFENMTNDDYEWIEELDIDNSVVDIKSYIENLIY